MTKKINKSIKSKLSKYYSSEDILKTNSTYHLIYGGRNAGKSYDFKVKSMKDAFTFDKQLALIFRTDKGKATNAAILKYFSDMGPEIEKLTKGQYDRINIKARELFFYKEEEDEETEVQGKDGKWKWKTIKGKKSRGPTLGYVFFLDEEQAEKSKIFPNIYNAIFEEVFISANKGVYYLQEEPTKLQSLISTVFRNNKGCKVFLIGNLHSTVNPYVSEWNLRDMFRQEVGTIKLYHFESSEEGKKIQMAVERVKNNNQQSYAISGKGKLQEAGEWEIGEYLTPQNVDLTGFNCRYEFVYTYIGFFFLCQFMVKGSDMIIYITRKSTPIQDGTRVIGDIPSLSLLYTTDFKPLVQREGIVFNLIHQNKIVFGNNHTGEDFNVALNTMNRNNR